MIGVCSVSGCERSIKAAGLCVAHYERRRIHGDVRADVPIRRIDRTLEERLIEKISPGPNGCLEWMGHRDSKGYGRVLAFGRFGKAERVCMRVGGGIDPGDLEVDHLCRNRSCVNPDHLEVVTHRENLLRGDGWGGRNARKTHCPRGHEYNDENTIIRQLARGPGRFCKECERTRASREIEIKREIMEKPNPILQFIK